MRITDLLNVKSIDLNGAPKNKEEAVKQVVALMAKSGNLSDVAAYEKQVFAREEESTTGVGDGVAIPHGKCDAVKKPGLAAMVVKDGVDYDALDGEPVDIIFLIAAPNTEDNVHLDVLSKLSMLLMDDDFTAKLKAAKTPEEFLRVIDDAETAKDGAGSKENKNGYEILAVTACPTGIAHTYMAAEALEKAGEKLGVSIKVETRGSGGAKNLITDEDIKNAKAIIVAADTGVPVDRFDGKRVIQVKVADGIHKPEELIKDGLAGKFPVFKASAGAEKTSESSEKLSIGAAAYKHLMSGVSHMLPFVIGGGILVALAFLFDTIAGYGESGGEHFGTMTQLSALFKYVGGLAMGLMVPVLAGYIAYSIADRPGLAVGFLGGLLAANGNASVADYIGIENSTQWSNPTGFWSFLQNFAFNADNGSSTISGFLGGIAAGFLAGAIILLLKKACAGLPKALEGIKPTLIYPVVGMLLMMLAMCFVLNPIIGVINSALSAGLTSLADSGMLWLLGLVLGGMMAIDMGGPINKAAYVTATGLLALQTDAAFIAMAAVMVGGMVPPIGIALATMIFPDKFTEAEKNSKVSNFVMGLGFITEAAIPFAAADPIHVIPATLCGSAVAGLLSALFKCTLRAPHGGIFVFATVGNPLLYIVALCVGSVITCALLGVLKKKVAK